LNSLTEQNIVRMIKSGFYDRKYALLFKFMFQSFVALDWLFYILFWSNSSEYAHPHILPLKSIFSRKNHPTDANVAFFLISN